MVLRVPRVELPIDFSGGLIKRLGAVPESGEVTRHKSKLAGATLEFRAKAAKWAACEIPVAARADSPGVKSRA